MVCHGTNSSLIPLHAYLLSLEKELVVVQIVLVGFDVGGSASTDWGRGGRGSDYCGSNIEQSKQHWDLLVLVFRVSVFC